MISNSLARHKNNVKKDRGKHGTYQEMIQTWVTYEVVKVIFLYGLNPEPNSTLEQFAPDLYTYVQHVKNPTNSTLECALRVHTTLFSKTSHSSYFSRCTFAQFEKVVWRDEVKFMIPIIILSWLRHLEQGFNNKSSTVSWSALGHYCPVDKPLQGHGADPLGLVYLSTHDKPDKIAKVSSYCDIKPDETYESTNNNYTIKSLELWAMMCLETPVQNKLLEATRLDKDTKKRHDTCKMLRQNNYKFSITITDYTKSNKDSRKRKIDESEFAPNPTKTKKSTTRKQTTSKKSPTTVDSGKKRRKSSRKKNSEQSNDFTEKTTQELQSMVTRSLEDINKLFTNVTENMDMTNHGTTLASLLKTIQETTNAMASMALKFEQSAEFTMTTYEGH